MGPSKAAEMGATGKGHMTDVAFLDVIPNAKIIWAGKTFLPFHPNGMLFQSLDKDGSITDEWTVYSVGGGALAEEEVSSMKLPEVYSLENMSEILEYCEWSGKCYWEYVEESEGARKRGLIA